VRFEQKNRKGGIGKDQGSGNHGESAEVYQKGGLDGGEGKERGSGEVQSLKPNGKKGGRTLLGSFGGKTGG